MREKTIAVQVIAGDPFVFNIFMEGFFNKWYNLVDKLYVQIKTSPESIVANNPILKKFYYDICKNDPKIVISEFDHNFVDFKFKNFDFDWYPKHEINWPAFCMRYVVDISNEDIIFFTHGDCFIVDPQILMKHFELVSKGEKDMVFDACGALSEQCAKLAVKQYPFLTEKMSEFLEFNSNYPSVGLTTSYFIANRKDLLKTKLNFERWRSGINSDLLKKPLGLDIPNELSQEQLYLETGHDVLFQLYKSGKTNPYIPCEDLKLYLIDLSGFKMDYENIKKIKRLQGHVHLNGELWSYPIYVSKIDEYISSYFSDCPDQIKNITGYEWCNYSKIKLIERLVSQFLSYIKQLNLTKYPYMETFVNETNCKIEHLVLGVNHIIKNINFINIIDDIKHEDSLFNDAFPYQIDIYKLPVEKVTELYS